MSRLLVVAYRTLGGVPLLDEVAEHVADGPTRVHVLVPIGDGGSEAVVAAREQLTAEQERLSAVGAEVTGEVVAAPPRDAILDALERDPYDEVVLCTLPKGLSRWLRDDLVAAVTAATDVPVRHVTAPAGRADRLATRAVRLTVYLGESDRYDGRPLTAEIVRRARRAGLAGATVLRGLEGFGASQVVRTARLVARSDDLPVVVVLVDTHERIEAFLPVLDELLDSGLVTSEELDVVVYGRRPRR
jgi:uncharacterized protein